MLNLDAQNYMHRLMAKVISDGGTDLHISESNPPVIRIDGKLKKIKEAKVLTAEEAKELALSLLTPEDHDRLQREKEIDFSYSYEDKGRFRTNVYFQKGNLSAALRLIPQNIKTIDELFLPSQMHNFTHLKQGFFLVVGPAGHGKTTALAALIDEINKTRADHIITIEDPIEYIYKQEKCIIDQREVYRDTNSFHKALKSALRQDPDVILVGELRDSETISAALTAAETGHLVLGTLHTNDAAQTIDRIVDSFPTHQQNQIRFQLANTLVGILSRRLVPLIEGGIRNAVELMIVNSAIRNLVRENKIYQIPSVIETSEAEGMIPLNRSLAELVRQGLIAIETAEVYSNNPNELRLLLQG